MLLGLFFYKLSYDNKTLFFIVAAHSTEEACGYINKWFKVSAPIADLLNHNAEQQEIRHIGYAKDGTKPGILRTA